MTDQQHTPDTAPSSVPAVVGVLGGGRMGGGIAHAFLVSGSSEVVVVERDPQSAEAAKEIKQLIHSSVEKIEQEVKRADAIVAGMRNAHSASAKCSVSRAIAGVSGGWST